MAEYKNSEAANDLYSWSNDRVRICDKDIKLEELDLFGRVNSFKDYYLSAKFLSEGETLHSFKKEYGGQVGFEVFKRFNRENEETQNPRCVNCLTNYGLENGKKTNN